MRPSPCFRERIRSHFAPSQHDAVTPRKVFQKNLQSASQIAIRAAYYRGGTSRAVIIQPRDLPKSRATWPSIFRQVMGSGDPYGRQLDGMGAGISSLSKICLVEPFVNAQAISDDDLQPLKDADKLREDQEADVDYTFVGLGIENDEVDIAGNCGNMSSAIGPYAYNARLLPARCYARPDGEIKVKIRNTNTGKMIDATFDTFGGQAAVVGNYTIDGVTGSGPKIKLDFKHPYGSKTGKVLPTGRKVDNIAGFKVSCVDGANPAVFIRASDIGVDGAILPNDFNKLPEKLVLLESIRKAAAVAMGIAPHEDSVPRTVPKIGLVSQSSAHAVLSGQTLLASQMDIVIRFISDTQPHRAIPLTAALTTAVAARIPGTIVEQLLAPDPAMEDAITIGHASGRIQVNARMNKNNNNKTVPVSATVYRTAKRLFEGKTFWTDQGVVDKAGTNYGTGTGHSLGMRFVLERRGQDSSHLDKNQRNVDTVDLDQQLGPLHTATAAKAIAMANSTPPAIQDPALPSDEVTGLPAEEDTISPAHRERPLTEALQRLHTNIDTLLYDRNVTTRAFPQHLLWTITKTSTKIAEHTRSKLRKDIPDSPITNALQRLRQAVRELMSDHRLMTREFPPDLLKDVRRTDAKIVEKSSGAGASTKKKTFVEDRWRYMANQIPGRRERMLKAGVREILRGGREI
ncbi:DUF453-domain-containing protein [Plenodomus tracheiphilus IPT5]|uniref:DUF453-domain-containing protein n=1 Tax=Plenodomus tracheiphilus IPT5 TaxID=1408161 RepID=A0A6A7B015_9PLEO|nr:DUF453-domain-containing protein [Plenodomus tracheiphilus IPT5]